MYATDTWNSEKNKPLFIYLIFKEIPVSQCMLTITKFFNKHFEFIP